MAYIDVVNYLDSVADPLLAEKAQRFSKTGEGEYAQGDIFIGIRVPVLRAAVKQFHATSINDAKRLLKSEYHEYRAFALLLLVAKYNAGDENEKETIYTLYLDHTQYINNWDLVDCSALHIVGAWLYERDKTVLYSLAKSNSLWERRIAIISCYYFIRKKQFTDTLKISEVLLKDKEDLIHKAVGWMLREVGNRDLATEEQFLKKYYQQMPRTMLRYAIEKFDEPLRQAYLKGNI